jgi:pseudaminic acid synthase
MISGLKIKKPFIIAEMSGNHNQSLERALRVVEAAANAGVDALKLQTYTPDTMTIDCNFPDFIINDPNSLWYGRKLYDLYKEAMTPWEWHKPIFDKCRQMGILPFSTPFDSTSVGFLEELDCQIYKIASFENTDIPLLKKIASTGKPVIMSTGMATIEELEESVTCLKENGCIDITLLKCTSTYPATPENCNILTIPDMRKRFGVDIGLSDHTLGIGVSIAAIALGATVIEKHFTLSRAEGGVDSAFSIEPEEMKQLVEECNNVHLALGGIKYGCASENEEKSKKFRRSIYAVQNIKAGEKLKKDNIRVIRPGYGLGPKFYKEIIGKRAVVDLCRGKPIELKDFE